jgi:CBS domain-containing protein
MTTQVVTLKGTDTVRQATVRLAIENLSGLPVVDGKKNLIGIVSETDILDLLLKYQAELNVHDPSLYILSMPMDDEEIKDEKMRAAIKVISETHVQEIMTKTVLTTSPNEKIINVVKAMIDRGVNRIPVLEKGVLVGIVSRGDIIFATYKRKA